MDKKKLFALLTGLLIVIVLGFFASRLINNSGKSIPDLIEFSIEDTTTVDKIIITDALSRKMEIVKKGKLWTDDKGSCIAQTNVHFILDAFKKIEFKGYLPKNSHKQFLKLMSAQHTKVEIFQNGSWTKTWYIGPAAADHHGQIMLLDDQKSGKSSTPVLMKIKGVHGIIDSRFYTDPRKWMCTNIFSLTLDEIAKVDIQFYDEPTRSFTVKKKNHQVEVYQQGKKIEFTDTAMVFRYLNNYKKIHYDIPNYELDKKGIDSLKKSQPFAVMNIAQVNGTKQKLRLFRIHAEDKTVNEFGQLVNQDMNKFWCELPNGEIVKCQYFVFNPLLLGHIYFPMDMSAIKMNEAAIVAN